MDYSGNRDPIAVIEDIKEYLFDFFDSLQRTMSLGPSNTIDEDDDISTLMRERARINVMLNEFEQIKIDVHEKIQGFLRRLDGHFHPYDTAAACNRLEVAAMNTINEVYIETLQGYLAQINEALDFIAFDSH